jgi:hypothetical protein
MINEPIPKTIEIDAGFDEEEFSSNPAPSFSQLNKMQELAIAGYSREEIDRILKAQELTDEEIEFVRLQATKGWKKEMRALQRNYRKAEEEKVWAAIHRKRCLGV